MTQRACSNCAWWRPPAISETSRGYCHGAPPTADLSTGEGLWPVTARTSFCGAFRISEAVIRQPAPQPQLLQEG